MATDAERYLQMSLSALEAELLKNYKPDRGTTYTGNDGVPPPPPPGLLDGVVVAARNALNDSPGRFRKTICVDLDYCRRRNSELARLVEALADCGLMAVLGYIFPPIMVASYLVRRHVLDVFCSCDFETGDPNLSAAPKK